MIKKNVNNYNGLSIHEVSLVYIYDYVYSRLELYNENQTMVDGIDVKANIHRQACIVSRYLQDKPKAFVYCSGYGTQNRNRDMWR